MVFVLTDKGKVWRSNDYGVNWVDESKNWERMEPEEK